MPWRSGEDCRGQFGARPSAAVRTLARARVADLDLTLGGDEHRLVVGGGRPAALVLENLLTQLVQIELICHISPRKLGIVGERLAVFG